LRVFGNLIFSESFGCDFEDVGLSKKVENIEINLASVRWFLFLPIMSFWSFCLRLEEDEVK
jgi:hypothetical protein